MSLIYVATAHWCDYSWVIAAGFDRAAVIRDAEIKVLLPRAGDSIIAEHYTIEEIPASPS